MATNERQDRLLEQLQEDERLRGDLEDNAATALLNWASDKLVAATNDPKRSDDEVELALQTIRTSARTAARSGVSDPTQVIAQAETSWTQANAQSGILAQQPSTNTATNAEPHMETVAAPATPPADTAPITGVAPQAHGAAALLNVNTGQPARPPSTPSTSAPTAASPHHPSGQQMRKVRRSWMQRLKTYLDS